MTLTVSSTDRRDGKALALFARCQDWQQGHTKDGRSFFAIPSGSDAGLFQMTDCNDCSCKDRQARGVACYHMRAVRLWMAAYKTGAVAPKPRPAAPTALDDLVVLLPAGAAYLTELAAADQDRAARQDADAAHAVTPTSWSPCGRGCGALVAPEDGRTCQDCKAKGAAAYRALYGADEDDKPYCTPCHRHHDKGAHYTARAS